MEAINKTLFSILNVILVAVLAIIPLGLVYQSIESARFARNHPDFGASCDWTGLLYFILIPAEIYLLIVFFWLRLLRKGKIDKRLKLVQLILILLIGAIPGLILLYPALFG